MTGAIKFPTPPPQGLAAIVSAALAAAGFPSTITVTAPGQAQVADVATAEAAMKAFFAAGGELQYWQTVQQAALDAFLNANASLAGLIRGGFAMPITAAQFSGFFAAATTNYRNLRAAIAAATTVAQVQAIVVTAGWPANP